MVAPATLHARRQAIELELASYEPIVEIVEEIVEEEEVHNEPEARSIPIEPQVIEEIITPPVKTIRKRGRDSEYVRQEKVVPNYSTALWTRATPRVYEFDEGVVHFEVTLNGPSAHGNLLIRGICALLSHYFVCFYKHLIFYRCW